jgi:citrate synthase
MQSNAELASLGAAEAAEWLGVKPQTLYAYASRGQLRRVGTGKRRRYLLEDLQRLQTRQRARSGHGPVAAAALSFGEPVLDTSITAIDERGPLYRGRPAIELALSGARFEAVAELLWTGELPAAPAPWPALAAPKLALGAAPCSLDELLFAVAALGAAFAQPAPTPELERELARRLVRSVAELLVPSRARGADGYLAELVAVNARAPKPAAAAALDLALVMLADHELNASSFSARIAASTGAQLLPCFIAALATLSGPRHGGACDRVEALLDEAASLPRPSDVLERRARRGDLVPGFGHPLYPAGDPRAPPLLDRARALANRSRPLARKLGPSFAVADSMQRQGLPPTIDFALVVLTRALGMRAGSAALLFALGRSAGWAAHVLEQRGSDAVLRPRARYLGA